MKLFLLIFALIFIALGMWISARGEEPGLGSPTHFCPPNTYVRYCR